MLIPVAIHWDDGSGYGVSIPDIPGCHSFGDTIEQALANAQSAIYNHVEVLIDLGEEVDIKISDISDLTSNADYAGAIWAFVHIEASCLGCKSYV